MRFSFSLHYTKNRSQYPPEMSLKVILLGLLEIGIDELELAPHLSPPRDLFHLQRLAEHEPSETDNLAAGRPAKQGAALCDAAESPGIAVRTIFLEKKPYAVLDLVHIVSGNAAEISGDLLGRDAVNTAEIHVEIATGNILFRPEDLKRLDKRLGTGLGVQKDSLEAGSESAFKFLRHELDVLRMAVATALDAAEIRPGLPMEVAKPVLFSLGELVAVSGGVLPVHELVKGKLHRVFAVGETIVVGETVHELDAELLIQFGPIRIIENFVIRIHFIFNLLFTFHTTNITPNL